MDEQTDEHVSGNLLKLNEIAKARARRVRPEVHEVLARDRTATVECLEPYELEHYLATGHLPPDRAKHAEGCEFCLMMLPELELDEERVRAAAAAAVALAAGADPEMVRAAEHFKAPRRRTWADRVAARIGQAAADAIAATTMVILVTGPIGLALYIWLSAASSTAQDLLLMFGSLVVLCGVAIAAAKWFPLPRWLRQTTWVGAAVTGVFLGIAIAAMWSYHLYTGAERQAAARAETEAQKANAARALAEVKDETAKGLELAQGRFQEQILESVDKHYHSGKFTELPKQSGPFSATSRISAKKATYEQTTSGIPGTFVAEVTARAGTLRLVTESGSEERGEMVVGRTGSASPGNLGVAIEPSGKKIEVPLKENVAAPANDSLVAVFLDTKKTAVAVRELSAPVELPKKGTVSKQ